MFLNEAIYWYRKYRLQKEKEYKSSNNEDILQIRVEQLSSTLGIDIDNQKYYYKNINILIVSTDNPNNGKAVGGKHIHIDLLSKGLNKLGISNDLVTYIPDENATLNINEMIKEFSIQEDMIKNQNINFIYLVYIIQKQLEKK
ncbi:hypothetical protein [Caloramator sp. Dgby_cultured_2]|uniref:hypothetical protein n=1 Tax=Caloramator sp. Dgby_cultured_2 TaxID=3029174 RepID=UPI00237DB84F|nr:hypothetical protein [Caloramator sp. Dgby_cultured_2]WDU83960.1 hypothetical protein PWK10_05715 [Caloramator sp. Dgby_cultured_2]